ncbi:MAG: DNA polymerase III subunit beta [Fusobacteriota bacterium]
MDRNMLNIKIDREAFLKGLKVVENAINENKIRPVISGVYLKTENNQIILKGTDLELTIDITVEGEIIEEGAIVFSHKLVEEYVKEINTEKLELIEKNGELKIQTSDSVSKFSLYEAEEYPVIQELDNGKEFYIDKKKFQTSLENTRIAAAESTENLAINCVRLEITDDKIKMISSDSFRMAYNELEIENEENKGKNLKISIPLKTVDSFLKVIKLDESKSVNLRYEGSQVYFRIGNISILSRTIDLSFPDYEAILGNAVYNKKVLSNKKELKAILRRVLIFVRNNTETKNSGIFNFVGNELLIKGVSDRAKVNEKVETLKTGDDLKISLNVKYLLDFINRLDSENIEMELQNASSAVLLHGEDDKSYKYLTMPLALREE